MKKSKKICACSLALVMVIGFMPSMKPASINADSETETTTNSGAVQYPAAEGKHEAESAISFTKGSASGNHAFESSDKYSGGVAVGGMNTWSNDGRAYCTTIVNANVAGTYKMTIAYGGGEEEHPCNIDTRINEGEWISTEAAPTSAWDTVETVELKVELVEGTNTIDVTGACNIWYEGMSWEWINLDYFELTKVEDETTVATTTSANTTETIEAATTGPAATEAATTGPAPTEVATTGPAPTEAATTGPAPTEVATTGPAPTEVATTGPAATEVATTAAAEKPAKPEGLTHAPAADGSLPYYFAWAAAEGAVSYNFYVNGNLVENVQGAGYNAAASLFAISGEYTVGVTSVNSVGVESDIATITYNVEGDTTTSANTTSSQGTTEAETTTATVTTTVANTTAANTTAAATTVTTTTAKTTTAVATTKEAQTTVKAPNVKIAKVNAKKKSSNKAKISLKKVKGVKGYMAQISTNKKFKKVLAKKTSKSAIFTIKSNKIKNKSKLFVRVRTYKIENGVKVYGDWSIAKKIKIK